MPQYDAILVPPDYKPPGDGPNAGLDRIREIHREFGPLHGGKHSHQRDVKGIPGHFYTPLGSSPGYYFPTLHPRSGEERYEWTDADPRGVRFGTLKPDAPEDVASLEAKAAARSGEIRKWLESPEGRAWMEETKGGTVAPDAGGHADGP